MTVKTILLLGAENAIYKEAFAVGAITPGHLVERVSTGKVQPHSTVDAEGLKLFARENEVFGNNIDEDYAADDTVLLVAVQAGSEVFGFLADTENVVIGERLVSDGAGGFQAVTVATTDAVLAYALEAVNNSSGSQARIKVEIA